MTKFIVVDVDATVVDTSLCWFKYLECLTKNKYRYMQELPCNSEGFIEYNLAKYYPELTEDEAFSFWHNPTLYDSLVPYPEAIQVLSNIEGDYHITFASMCKPNHKQSKMNFIDRWFGPQLKVPYSFVDTDFKGALKADVVIDDRRRFIGQFNKYGTIGLLLETPYTQDAPLSDSMIECQDWRKIEALLGILL